MIIAFENIALIFFDSRISKYIKLKLASTIILTKIEND